MVMTATPARIRRVIRQAEYARVTDHDIVVRRPSAQDGYEDVREGFFDNVEDAQILLNELAQVVMIDRKHEAIETDTPFGLGTTLPITPQIPKVRCIDRTTGFDEVMLIRGVSIDLGTERNSIEVVTGGVTFEGQLVVMPAVSHSTADNVTLGVHGELAPANAVSGSTADNVTLGYNAPVVGVTGQEFRIRPIVAGRTSEPYMRLGGIEFLSGGSMPSGYTTFSSGLAAGTTANLFDGNSGTNAAMSIDGSSNAGVTFAATHTIDTVRLNAGFDFLTQYAREWAFEYRAVAGTGAWIEAQRFYSGQFTSNETRSFNYAGDANPAGYQQLKITIVSNFGSAGTNTYFVELGIVDEDGATEIQRDFKSATNYGEAMGTTEQLYDGVYGTDNYDRIVGIPADVVIDWGRKKLPSKIKIGFRNAPFQEQGPDRLQVRGSNDSFATSTLLLDTGSGALPAGAEIRTFNIP